MTRPLDIAGQTFGRLVAERRVLGLGRTAWLCRCACGGVITARTDHLRARRIVSCGCVAARGPNTNPPADADPLLGTKHLAKIRIARSARPTRIVKHGKRGSPEYTAWQGMTQRCHNPANPSYCDYGARGISVCPEWRADFAAFYAHIGPKPGASLSVDRINVDGNYEPGNVRWATTTQQRQNQRPRKRKNPKPSSPRG